MNNYLTVEQRKALLVLLYNQLNERYKTFLREYFAEKGFGEVESFKKKVRGARRHNFSVQEIDTLVGWLIQHTDPITTRATFAEHFYNLPEYFGYELPQSVLEPINPQRRTSQPQTIVSVGNPTPPNEAQSNAFADYVPKTAGGQKLKQKMIDTKQLTSP